MTAVADTSAVKIDSLSVPMGNAMLFRRLSLSVKPGEQVTLSGPSGAGKSTLLRCILGFRGWSDGAIYIHGEALHSRSVWRLRGLLAYVGQEPDLGDGLVRDALTRALAYRRNQHLHFDVHDARALFERFLLPTSLMEKATNTLSGGEKQRIALAAGVLLKRPVLLLDEVASALDGNAKQAVRDYLCEMTGTTIISVSHDTRDFALTGPVVDMSQLTRKPCE